MDEERLNQLAEKHQSIKIVPSVEDTFRAIGLNLDIDERIKAWFDQLKSTWRIWKRSTPLENQIVTFFLSVSDPFRLVLVFIIQSEDFKDCKPKSLSYFVMESLLKWSTECNVTPNESLKMPAFHLAIQQRNQHFLSLVVKTYKLSTVKESILLILHDKIKNDNCKLASQIVIAMELFDDVPVEELMFPLILQDKNNMIDEYLSECPSQVKPLLNFLDTLLDKKFALREYIDHFMEDKKIGHIRYDKMHYKPLGKLVARLCNKFNVPIENCKNLSKNRTIGGLRYLIHQKYIEKNVSLTVWDDLVKDSLRQNASSVPDFIDMLIDHDNNEAIKWATYFKVPETTLPLALKGCCLQDPPEKENWDTPTANNKSEIYYKFSLTKEKIIMIDTGEKFYDLILSLANYSVVSIDCEWKPSFGASQSQVALIQVATNDFVYLIDTLKLNNPQNISFWYTFYKSFLDNAEIIKVGFGLEQDLKEMKASVIGLANAKVKGEGLLDLSVLWRCLINSGLSLPGNSDNSGHSLSSLVQACFGLPLEKAEQCSNWELRPLRDTQIQYAALDAHILVQIYNYLQNQSLQQGINFEEICNDAMNESKKKVTTKKTKSDRLKFFSLFQAKKAAEIKILVESGVPDLMCYLRYCGIDTTVAPSTLLWYEVINMAISEDRFILLNKLKYTPTTNFSQNCILAVGIGNIVEQLYKVLNTINVEIAQQDLLRHCIMCNSMDLKKLSSGEVHKLCVDYKTAGSNVPNVKYDKEEEDPGYDNYLTDSDCDDDIIHSESRDFKTLCTTSKGAMVRIENVQKLEKLQKSGILCEECGKLYWDGDEFLKTITETMFKIINVKVW